MLFFPKVLDDFKNKYQFQRKNRCEDTITNSIFMIHYVRFRHTYMRRELDFIQKDEEVV